MDQRLTKLSKTLAYLLRHNPSAVGLELDPAGWVQIDVLLGAMSRAGHHLSRADFGTIVHRSDKTRYEIDNGRVRAAQGHSIPIQLALAPSTPPELLYHGTVERFMPSIQTHGLRPGNRNHVHLSADPDTARAVGNRRGRPTVLTIAAGQMDSDGYTFTVAANNVWLTDHVPPNYLTATPPTE